jgi:hypothetical protein
MRSIRLTRRILDALDSALAFKLAGELEDDEDRESYEHAQQWVHQRFDRLDELGGKR